MISEEVENRIARYYFHRYLPTSIMEELESLLLPYFLEKDEPSADEMVRLAISYIEKELN
ncbi:hypothetical protein [Fundicoccus culcitae]|uniref:CdiI immunity protein domain-containing protein n=1 Tax=Fundicoccus culcitae TaxID=2969821 RepID=A0ABY5PA47_9LACT|nr:hypothetical protein [Fundicoccus culcitae]UUX35233.1 hypothetical protein NRE15_06210 [Fundicoccus culcitae]